MILWLPRFRTGFVGPHTHAPWCDGECEVWKPAGGRHRRISLSSRKPCHGDLFGPAGDHRRLGLTRVPDA